MPRKRKYEEFFTYEPNGLARCRRGGCFHPTMPRAHSNGMKKHIQLYHPNDYQRFLALEKGEQSGRNQSHNCAAAETSGPPPGSDSEVSKTEAPSTNEFAIGFCSATAPARNARRFEYGRRGPGASGARSSSTWKSNSITTTRRCSAWPWTVGQR